MTDIDSKIGQLFAVLNKKKQQVENREKQANRKWKTNCSFSSPINILNPINIQTASQESLVVMLSELLIKDNFTHKACEELGVEYTGKWGSYLVSDWIQDMKTRAAKIQLISEKNELAELESRLQAIVSPEQRRLMELEAIAKSLEK